MLKGIKNNVVYYTMNDDEIKNKLFCLFGKEVEYKCKTCAINLIQDSGYISEEELYELSIERKKRMLKKTKKKHHGFM
jgi:hypothetical protein